MASTAQRYTTPVQEAMELSSAEWGHARGHRVPCGRSTNPHGFGRQVLFRSLLTCSLWILSLSGQTIQRWPLSKGDKGLERRAIGAGQESGGHTAGKEAGSVSSLMNKDSISNDLRGLLQSVRDRQR